MPTRTTVRDIPESKLASKVRQLALSGSTEIQCVRQDDDKWTITSTDPD